MTMDERQETAPSGRHTLALAALMARVGEELETLARLSTDVQRALSTCGVSEGSDAQAIRELQGIDRITQSLEDLGRLMSDISAEIPEDINLRAGMILSRLRLHELIENLDPDHEKHVMAREDDGEITWL